MAGGDSGDKTEKPTAKKKEDLRKKGVSARSQEMPQAVSLLVLVIALPLAMRNLAKSFYGLLSATLSGSGSTDLTEAGHLGRAMLLAGARAMAVPIVLVGGSAVLTSLLITRQKPNPKLMKPKMESLSPKNGIKRVFGTHGLMEFGKTTGKLAIMALIGFLAWRQGITRLINSAAPLDSVVAAVTKTTSRLLLEVAAVAVLIGLVDLAWSLRKYGKQSKMSKQEIRDESKAAEVNPEVKGAIRSKQMKLSRSRMMAAVAGADVVLTNPTHYAVALKYESGSFAPVVVAKGANEVARRIREKAYECGVPVQENKPLARALHAACQLGDSIPVELFRAVAEVLAAVYATKRRRGGSRPTGRVPPQRTPGSASAGPAGADRGLL